MDWEIVEKERQLFSIDTCNYDKTKIKTKKCIENKYILLNNDSSFITFDDEKLRLYRSLVLDAETKEMVCFSPPNSIDFDTFQKKYPKLSDNEIYANEIIEGTMINLFYDKKRETWEIATRGSIGGNYWYYKTKYILDEKDNTLKKDGLEKEYEQKTFRQMFIEALRGDESDNLNNNPIIKELHKSYSYSFVLQHPDNHIVLPITEPHLFLVGVYLISDLSTVDIILPIEYENWSCFSSGIIEFPKSYLIENMTFDDFKKKYDIIFTSNYSLGIMFTHLKTKNRTTIMNPVYEELKRLRGNNPNLQYHYFCLLRAGQQNRFLEYFPIYTSYFIQFQTQYHEMITNVHRAYFSYYVKKEGIEIAKKYFIHASKIHHQIYLPSLKIHNGKKVITRNVVKDYFDAMKPNEILYYLHYDKRQIAMVNNQIIE